MCNLSAIKHAGIAPKWKEERLRGPPGRPGGPRFFGGADFTGRRSAVGLRCCRPPVARAVLGVCCGEGAVCALWGVLGGVWVDPVVLGMGSSRSCVVGRSGRLLDGLVAIRLGLDFVFPFGVLASAGIGRLALVGLRGVLCCCRRRAAAENADRQVGVGCLSTLLPPEA